MKLIPIFLYLFCCVTILSCVDHDAHDSDLHKQIVEEGVQIRISEFRQREWEKCVEQAKSRAIQQVDSIIRAMAKDEAIEPVIKPPKPDRPEKPGLRILPDSIRNQATGKPDSIIKE